jgi:hypothetical protein
MDFNVTDFPCTDHHSCFTSGSIPFQEKEAPNENGRGSYNTGLSPDYSFSFLLYVYSGDLQRKNPARP